MAKNKSTRSRKQKKEVSRPRKQKPRKQKKEISLSHYLYFPEVKGKMVETVEIDPAVEVIFILFEDKTALSFQLEPRLGLLPELSDWITGSAQPIKEWNPIQSKPALAKWWS